MSSDDVASDVRGGALPGPLEGVLRPRRTLVLYRGTLTRVEPGPRPFPVIMNGQRVTVPALVVRGAFTANHQRRLRPTELSRSAGTPPHATAWSRITGLPATGFRLRATGRHDHAKRMRPSRAAPETAGWRWSEIALARRITLRGAPRD